MIEKGKDTSICCNYCGWKIPQDFIQKIKENAGSLFCEFCGIEIELNINKTSEKDIKENLKGASKPVVSENSSLKKSQDYSVRVIIKDENFPKIFKENLIIVISRLIYIYIRIWENETDTSASRETVTESSFYDLACKIKPIIDRKISHNFLGNLDRIDIAEFEDWLRLLQKKLHTDESYLNHFKFFLLWLIKIVIKLISEMWEMKNIPIFHSTILNDLKNYNFSFAIIEEDSEVGTSDKTANINIITDSFRGDQYSKSMIHKFKENLSENVINREEEIIQISRSEVELRWYEKYKRNFKKKYFILFEKVDIILDNLIKSHRFPLYLDEISPKFAKKYLSIYESQNPETKEWFIRDYLTRALVGDGFFKKILDKKAYGAIIYRWRFLDESNVNRYYLGVTTTKERSRFAQHIADSIIRYSAERTMTKKAEVIIQALKTHGLKDSDFNYYFSQIHHKKFYEIGDVVMPLVKRCENLFEREILEIHKSKSTAIHKEKLYVEGIIDGINYKIDGLNEISGGGGGIGIELPLYDVCMMITFGFEYKTIKEFLLRFYDVEVSVRQIQKRISSYFSGSYNKSSRYNVNKEFLKPVIEILLYEQFLGKLDEKKYQKILNFLKSIFKKEDKLKLKTWFWSFYRGESNLDFIYWEKIISDSNICAFNEWFIKEKRYYGISRSTWINWVINRVPLKKICLEGKLSRKQVKHIRERLHSREILRKFQKYITIKYRQEGRSWKKIYEDKLNYTAYHRTDRNGIKYGPDFFERMFQIQFHHLKFETFSDIDLNKISKWNNIDFSKFDIA